MVHARVLSRGWQAAVVLAAGLVFAPASAGEIALAWDATQGASSYKVYYGTAPGQYSAFASAGSNQTTLTGLQDCTTYYIAVKAVNGAGESTQFSNEVSGWARPSVISSNPSTAKQGDQAVVTIGGANFQSGAVVTSDNPLVRISSVSVLDCNRVQFVATLDPPGPNVPAARIGPLSFEVRNPDTVYGQRAGAFTVLINPARFDINQTDDQTRNRIDGKDTVWLARLFGVNDTDALFDPDYDFDGDGWIDGEDISYLASNMGGCWSAGAWSSAACPSGLR